MNIVILHYHLNRGGVTGVIAHQLLALDRAIGNQGLSRAAIIYGGRATGWPADLQTRLQSIALSLHPLEGLDYDTNTVAEPAALAEKLRTILRRLRFPLPETLLHVHNHSLGKNVSLPGALRLLAQEGCGLLLEIHDFAEDFRSANFQRLSEAIGRDNLYAELYPQSSRVHYAVLNRRDFSVLKAAGVAEDRLHFLPNSVPKLGPFPDRIEAKRKLHQRLGIPPQQQYVLYPVRGIRRKNLGEMLLWSVLAGPHTTVGMTLAPLNPAEKSRYNRWKALAAELRLNCRFETGEAQGLSFEENLAAADRILTTSVAEGFGMVFLESWLAERPLVGRNLPEVTIDFVEAGVRFDGLYERLEVPVAWIGREQYRKTFRAAYSRVLKAYGRPPLCADQCERAISQKIRGDDMDFADLDEPMQERVIRRAVSTSADRSELLSRNRAAFPPGRASPELIARNKQAIDRVFSLAPSGRRLREIGRMVLASPESGAVTGLSHGERILDRFLDPVRFRLIRE